MKVGIGVGIPLGIIVLALLGFFLWRHRKNKKRPEPPSIEKAPPAGALDPEYMYKGNADLGTPATATTVSPDLNKRASSKYVTTDADEGSRYRGIKKAGLGLDTEPPVHELPESTAQDELPGESRELRSSQMSELAGSGNHPAELPGQIHR